MLKSIHIVLLATLLSIATAPAWAAGEVGYGTYVPPAPAAKKSESYGETIGRKAGSGFANIGLSFLEVPKNIINTNNEINMAAGVTLGAIKGLIHMCGRAMAGTIDLITFPVPTQPITTPAFVWEKFNVETRYNGIVKPQQ